jgi:hypothetical protein
MIFTIELEDIEECFRLQKNESWRECISDKSLKESDFISNTASDVIKRSNYKGMLEINGILYEINPDQVNVFSGKKYLDYSSSVFRQIFPKEPTLAQLKSTIASGDDSTNNCLILNIQGNFELIQSPPFNQLINDPSIVVRHETFICGNGYVGPEAAAHDTLMHDLFVSSLEHWKDHLQYHITQEYSDIHSIKTLKQIQKELKELRENWHPDY